MEQIPLLCELYFFSYLAQWDIFSVEQIPLLTKWDRLHQIQVNNENHQIYMLNVTVFSIHYYSSTLLSGLIVAKTLLQHMT